jgi:hypothetical protein
VYIVTMFHSAQLSLGYLGDSPNDCKGNWCM